MQHPILLAACFLLCAVPASAQDADHNALRNHNADWIQAYPEKDTTVIKRIAADDLVMITSNGTRLSKKELIRNVAKPAAPITSATIDNVDITVKGNIGIVVAQVEFIMVVNGKETTVKNNYMDIYEKRDGQWVAIAAHVTRLDVK
ncbi:nuclear transport factor 2 family protein [Chitinophaga sp. NPDC101104]|uniref:nuclear transport factor 2 family protein n=1 Tax=Chitinophaga sp. NPDC101104 TaxID=3390561 RepID=UPI003D07AFFE